MRLNDFLVACFSHAASVALVAALLNCDTLAEAGAFAPCGVFRLVTEDGGDSWSVESRLSVCRHECVSAPHVPGSFVAALLYIYSAGCG